MRKRIILSGYYGFKNFGDEAILDVLINKLSENNHILTVISSNPEFTKSVHKNVKSVYTFDFVNIVAQIIKSDILISGGGSLLQDVTSLRSLFYYLAIITFGLIFRKKVIIFAQGIGPVRNAAARFCMLLLLKKCSYVSVRDIKSLEFLKSNGVDAKLVCDPIFSLKIQNQPKDDSVAVQLRNFRTMNQDFIDRLAQKTNEYFSQNLIKIFSFQDSIDVEVCKNFENTLKLLNPNIKTQFYYNLTNEQIIDEMTKSKYFIAMRFHAIILGILANSNILAINYDTKVEKISTEFDLPIIDLKQPFKNQFDTLKNKVFDSQNRMRDMNFDWIDFDNAING